MAYLDRNALLKKEEFKVERVDLPNGDYVFIRQMSAKMKDDLESSIMKKVFKDGQFDFEQDFSGFNAKLAALSLCDETGALLLSLKDAPLLAENKPSSMIDAIAVRVSALNEITTDAKASAVKNSEADQPEGSFSGCVES